LRKESSCWIKQKTGWQKSKRVSSNYGGIFDVAAKKLKLEELEARAAAPDFWNDANKARTVIAETNGIKAVLAPSESIGQSIEDLEVMLELAGAESDPDQRKAADKECARLLEKLESDYRRFELQSLLSDTLDANNAYVSINAGAGGTESCDWAQMLVRMFSRYCERAGYGVTVMDLLRGDEAGIKSCTMQITGPYAYGYLKGERGVHRLVRISPFDSNKRRHTSFVACDVVAEVDDSIEITIDEKDLRVDTFRASGAGGQHVNKTDSAIRIVHIPTGVVVSCQAERSQHSNRDKAMKMLTAKLYELERAKQSAEMEKFYGDKGEIAWGSQIRSYILQPYQLVKDHRTEVETGNVDAVLDGDIQDFIEGYLKMKKSAR
jgi:peptide chain release factor 2